MNYQVKIKTGFYQTSIYDLKIILNYLIFDPKDRNLKLIRFNARDLTSITLIYKKHLKISLMTEDEIFEAVFLDEIDILAFHRLL